jgi:hypothetical protein
MSQLLRICISLWEMERFCHRFQIGEEPSRGGIVPFVKSIEDILQMPQIVAHARLFAVPSCHDSAKPGRRVCRLLKQRLPLQSGSIRAPATSAVRRMPAGQRLPASNLGVRQLYYPGFPKGPPPAMPVAAEERSVPQSSKVSIEAPVRLTPTMTIAALRSHEI